MPVSCYSAGLKSPDKSRPSITKHATTVVKFSVSTPFRIFEMVFNSINGGVSINGKKKFHLWRWQSLVITLRKPFFPESERTSPSVGGRPHSTARALPGGRARRTQAERGDMNRCRRKRCGQSALFRRIRQSTRCQQKEQLMLWLLSAVNRESG